MNLSGPVHNNVTHLQRERGQQKTQGTLPHQGPQQVTNTSIHTQGFSTNSIYYKPLQLSDGVEVPYAISHSLPNGLTPPFACATLQAGMGTD